MRQLENRSPAALAGAHGADVETAKINGPDYSVLRAAAQRRLKLAAGAGLAIAIVACIAVLALGGGGGA